MAAPSSHHERSRLRDHRATMRRQAVNAESNRIRADIDKLDTVEKRHALIALNTALRLSDVLEDLREAIDDLGTNVQRVRVVGEGRPIGGGPAT